MKWLLSLTLVMLAAPAFAYVGPGPGLSMLGSFFTLVGGILLALLMVLIYPLRLLYKRMRGQKASPQAPRD